MKTRHTFRAAIVLAFLLATTSGMAADDFQTSIKAAETFRKQKQYDAAMSALGAARAQAVNDTELGLAIGKQAEIYAFDLRDYASARNAADVVVGLKDAAPVARVTGLKVQAQCQIKADNDYKAAIKTLQQAARLKGVEWAQPTIALMLGDCYRSTSRFNEALAAYGQVARLNSASNTVKATAYLNGGMTFQYDLRRMDRAKVLYAKAVELDAGLQGEVQRHMGTRTDSIGCVILAHYMPWYEAKPVSPAWGWHWTMNHFDPERIVDGKHQVASHFYPIIGPYDSSDPKVLEYHLLLMKLAGIDGVIVDWYGLQDFRDYAILHRNTQRLVDQVDRLGLKFAICYEDQTIPALVENGRLKPQERVTHARREIEFLAENWFALDCYIRIGGRPILLSFGQTGLTDDEWSQCLAGLESPIAYFSQHHRRAAAMGAFDWPIPMEGPEATKRFEGVSRSWSQSIAVAFPRFVDIYSEAKVQESHGRINDDGGATFRTSLERALTSNSRIIQIATWNDWGEGTIIEPSREYGYRDLEVLQEMRRKHVDPSFSATASDLRLPRQLLRLRRETMSPDHAQQLDRIAELITDGKLSQARSELTKSATLP